MESLWSKGVRLREYKPLESEIRVKNVVIGAGIAGILIAYFLQENEQEVIVLEANEVASGQTKNTTAKITSQHGLIYYNMLKNAGRKRAEGYAEANEAAIKKYKEIITKEGIACEFVELPSFLYSTKAQGVQKLKKEAEVANSLGIKAKYVSGEKIKELPFGVVGAVKFEDQAQFHPLKFIQGITEKLQVYEHTKVTEVDGHFVHTNRGIVVAENVIFATHYPFPLVPGYYFLRQHQSRSYVLALAGEGVDRELRGMYYGIDKEDLSFRCAEGRLLLGGGAHRTGKRFVVEAKKKADRAPGSFEYLRKKAKQYYPMAKEVEHWFAQDCMPHDGIPFIGKFSRKEEHWYVATGFQKWGMTSAMIAAMVISDMILGRKNPYAEVFSPKRLLIKAGIKKFLIDVCESTIGLTKGIFVSKEKKCPHMGCALSWNEEEKSWDCPCHGSRFERDGTLIDNPAQTNSKEDKIS